MIGQTLGHYEVTAKLGEGGMGEVYRARDTKLGRDVAIKVLPAEMNQNPERLARFEREARSLAALHHPNVASIFGFEKVDEVSFLVMEYVEGEDLAQRLQRGPVSVEDATDIATQVAHGLEAAHERSIAHRDLKPANVRITPEGQVKILDFGLARDYKDDAGDASTLSGRKVLENSPTLTAAMTQHGLILGTASYMSPEQARGKPVDHRADIWSFGVILWEMLSGNRLFQGETTTDILANVLKHEIDFDAVPAGTPIALRRLLARCLQRDPKRRLHSIADARLELEDGDSLFPAEVGAAGEPSAAGASSRLQWILIGLLALASILLMWRPWATPLARIADPMALSIEIPEELELNLIDWAAVATSRDGSAIAVTARAEGQLTVQLRTLNELGFKRLSPKGNAFHPFFSPDGRWVGYYSDGRLLKVSVDGGAPVELATMSHPRGATWGDDGYVYYAPGFSTGIHRRSESGTGEEEVVTVVDTDSKERSHRWPEALPDGRGVVFTVGTTDSPGDYEDSEIAVYDALSKETRYLGVQGAIARWSPSGHLLVMRNGILHAVLLDLNTLTLIGVPAPVFDGIRGDPASGVYYFAVNERGDFYYVPAREGGPQRSLVWVSRDGSTEPLTKLEPGPYRFPRIRPGGDLVALILGEGHGAEEDTIYLLDPKDTSLTRFTFESSITPNWLPSGDSLLFSNVPKREMQVKNLDGTSGARTVLEQGNTILLPGSIGSKGRIVLSTVIGQASLGDLYASDTQDPSKLEAFVATDAAEWGPDLSPDRKWVVYCSDETGREEIFVQPYPPTGAKWQVSKDGGRGPRWSHKGDEIFFVEGHSFYSASVATTPTFKVQTPEILFQHRMDTSGVPLPNYDVTEDDQRFLIVEADAAAGSRKLRVVLNWLDSLEDPAR